MINDQFYKGETVSLSIEIRGKLSNALTNPTSITITILTAKGIKKVDVQPMVKKADGKYSFLWLSDEVGSYTVIYKADNSGSVTILKDTFNVIQ
jgi:hypothetical protein